MNILLLGKYGQLGWELHRALMTLGTVTALDTPEIDLCDRAMLERIVQTVRPNVIINAAAYTAVDRAEQEAELALAINAAAPGCLAALAAQVGAVFIHYSTDYVFDGAQTRPYTEDDLPNPLGVYAAGKLAGEQAVAQAGGAYLILRTSWLYSLRRDCFVTKVLAWSRQQSVLHVVTDQVSNPTWARAMAEITAQLIALSRGEPYDWLGERHGIYHLAGDGFASRYEFAQAILKYDPRPQERCTKEIQPALTAEFPTPARRPLFTALDCTRFTQTFGLRLPSWEETLQLAMQDACLPAH